MSIPPLDKEPAVGRNWVRRALFVFGWVNVALGAVGVFVPGLPTTVFLIAALWAFSKSSQRFHDWLWNHPRFGPTIQNWNRHRIIPVRAKILAVLMMSSSFLFLTFYVAESWLLPTFMAVLMGPPAVYVITRRSRLEPARIGN